MRVDFAAEGAGVAAAADPGSRGADMPSVTSSEEAPCAAARNSGCERDRVQVGLRRGSEKLVDPRVLHPMVHEPTPSASSVRPR